MYRTFLFGEMAASAGGGFAGARLPMPARLLIGEHDPLGAALAAGFERHGEDAAHEVVPGRRALPARGAPRAGRRAGAGAARPRQWVSA